jgi:hypothetical protein
LQYNEKIETSKKAQWNEKFDNKQKNAMEWEVG